ncbi:helix-turn-helix domain-containing protein [Acinetobacter piscicola]|uniref:helix-turn-helix domain-containing protein n=1 Tax=Acinetobacter piscicola TaxID=2006115 RepID=UPI00101FDE9F|nr:helix-turn-helix domain-containing protein [Acinetobacter piscicola]RYL27744.1 DNA-binding protein [Acinetobacter piscicola]
MSTNHQTQVLAHLKTGNTITQAEAINLFHCYRLSAVINRLRNSGHDIVTHQEPNHKRDGYHARYEYRELKA